MSPLETVEILAYCWKATRLGSRLISVAYMTSLGSLRQKPGSFEEFWMYVYHRICLDFKKSKSKLFRFGRTAMEEKVLFRVESHVFAGEELESK